MDLIIKYLALIGGAVSAYAVLSYILEKWYDRRKKIKENHKCQK